MKHLPMKHHAQPVRCKVRITLRDGKTFAYSGLYKSTSEAAMDALERFGFGSVSVRKAA